MTTECGLPGLSGAHVMVVRGVEDVNLLAIDARIAEIEASA